MTGDRISPETLIEHSFEFLLERESNTMILARFDLPVIGDYFPEYEKNIVQRFYLNLLSSSTIFARYGQDRGASPGIILDHENTNES